MYHHWGGIVQVLVIEGIGYPGGLIMALPLYFVNFGIQMMKSQWGIGPIETRMVWFIKILILI
jgi:hypothetical protein